MIVGRSYARRRIARLGSIDAAENQYDRAVTGVGSRWSGSDSDRARRPARGPGRKRSHRDHKKGGEGIGEGIGERRGGDYRVTGRALRKRQLRLHNAASSTLTCVRLRAAQPTSGCGPLGGRADGSESAPLGRFQPPQGLAPGPLSPWQLAPLGWYRPTPHRTGTTPHHTIITCHGLVRVGVSPFDGCLQALSLLMDVCKHCKQKVCSVLLAPPVASPCNRSTNALRWSPARAEPPRRRA